MFKYCAGNSSASATIAPRDVTPPVGSATIMQTIVQAAVTQRLSLSRSGMLCSAELVLQCLVDGNFDSSLKLNKALHFM